MSRARNTMRIVAADVNFTADSESPPPSSRFEITWRTSRGVQPAVRQTFILLSIVPIIAPLARLANAIATGNRGAQNRILNVNVFGMAASLGGNPFQKQIDRAIVRLHEVFRRAFGKDVLPQPGTRTSNAVAGSIDKSLFHGGRKPRRGDAVKSPLPQPDGVVEQFRGCMRRTADARPHQRVHLGHRSADICRQVDRGRSGRIEPATGINDVSIRFGQIRIAQLLQLQARAVRAQGSQRGLSQCGNIAVQLRRVAGHSAYRPIEALSPRGDHLTHATGSGATDGNLAACDSRRITSPERQRNWFTMSVRISCNQQKEHHYRKRCAAPAQHPARGDRQAIT